ncbi:MAG TPA: DUF4058 domain-containing protein [Gemmataceae bacterium]|nr:DUF4058 domain-containing protein [Gemmataceae bacterium]
MPVHDWTRVDAGLFHNFHLGWICALSDALNLEVLPSNYFALVEQRIPGSTPHDLIAGLPLGEAEIYARKADRIAVRRQNGGVVFVLEIVSPGIKSSFIELQTFVEQMAHLIIQNVNLLVIDLFPPGAFDPQGIHKAIWDELQEDSFDLPKNRPLTLTAYNAGPEPAAYIEPVAVGDVLPDMPLFLSPEILVSVPLEATYQTRWKAFPAVLKRLLQEPPPA